MFAQSTWQTAQPITHGTSSNNINYSSHEYWIKFDAITTFIGVQAIPDNNIAAISLLELYKVNGSSIEIIGSIVSDLICNIENSGIIIGQTYYIKIYNENPLGSWSIHTRKLSPIIHNAYPDEINCPPECSNLITNGDFETMDPLVQNAANNSPFRLQAFGTYDDYPNNITYKNMVCGWDNGWDGQFTSPQMVKTNNNNYAYMKCDLGFNTEIILTKVKLVAGKSYNFSMNYYLYDGNNINNPCSLSIAFSSSSSTLGAQILSLPNSPSSATFGPIDFQFVAQQDWNYLIIYPTKIPKVNSKLFVDDIKIQPVDIPEEIVLSGPSTTCNQTGDMTFTIVNYDPVNYIYRYQVNNDPIEVTTSNTFSIDASQFTQQVNTIKIWNWCEIYSEFKVYQCCEPTGYTLFADEDITNTKVNTVTNSKMVINGTVHIHDNITINNFDIRFGPMAKLIIDDGYNFTVNGGTLEDGCDYPWDGIYIDNTNTSIPSKLKLNGVTSIKGAYNAVVSSNNAEIELINNHFINNNKGVRIRDYKSNICEPVAIGDPPIVVPPYNAIITGNVFEKSANIFNSFGDYYGIQIDTVYDITIGDENYTKNIFKKVHIGIKVNSSWVNIYNNRFENIYNASGTPILNSSSNKPLFYIAIMADKYIAPATQSPNYSIPYNFECSASKIIVGKVGANGGNEFDNCDFGIYAHKHITDVINNDFVNQISNAVWIWDTKSKVNYNSIQQKTNTWFNNANLNTAILIEKTYNPAATYNLQIAEVKNNTISNTRTGISLIHCSSMPFNSSIKTMVKDNDITFDYYSSPTYSGHYKYTGIWLSACNRSVVYGNEVSNTSGVTVNASDYRGLIGIRIDKTREAQVSHNFNLNYLGTGIWINGDCHNTQLFCNTFKAGKKGVYTYTPSNSSGFAAVLLDQGTLTRPQDNFFQQMQGPFVSGLLNTVPNNYFNTKWYYRNTNAGYVISNIDNHVGWPINITSQTPSCTGGIIPPPDPTDDEYNTYIDEMYGEIVRNELDYVELEDEFEYFDDEYLYEVLYNNPGIMNLGEPEDTAYANFYAYLTNSNVREFIDVQGSINEDDINQALMDNGAIVAQNVIEANKKYVNDVYLNSFAQDKYFTESQRQTLQTIAMLTPYIGGDAVYSARVMLGINPNTYNLAYRIGNFADSNSVVTEDNILKTYPNPVKGMLTLEFVYPLEVSSVFTLFDVMGRVVMEVQLSADNNQFEINTSDLENGIYFYNLSTDDKAKGKIIINN